MHPICEKLKGIRITGNIVPTQFYHHIRRKSGKADPIGVTILSDILYWYRPLEIRDTKTGQVIGYRQKFKNDKLQVSYQGYADHYEFGKSQVKSGIKNLVRLGLVKQEFRNITLPSGHRLFNVMFIEPDFEKITKILGKSPAPDNISNDSEYDEKISYGPPEKIDTAPAEKKTPPPQKNPGSPLEKAHTNTETIKNEKTAATDPARPSPDAVVASLLDLVPETQRTPAIEKMIRAKLKKHDPEWVRRNIAYAVHRKPNNFRNYAAVCIDNDYADGWEPPPPPKQQKTLPRPVPVTDLFAAEEILLARGWAAFDEFCTQRGFTPNDIECVLNRIGMNEAPFIIKPRQHRECLKEDLKNAARRLFQHGGLCPAFG